MAKILVVDDDEGILSIVREYLEARGFGADTAYSAIQARHCLENSEYDAIISDFKMPGESGIDLLRDVLIRFPGLPFILMTGYHTPHLEREARQMGCSGYLAKPFQMSDLLGALGLALRQNEPGMLDKREKSGRKL